MTNIPRIPPGVVEPIMSVIASSAVVDIALRKLGASRNRPPAAVGDSWLENLAWGSDSFYAATRLLFSGQFVGAAAILRSQFERWTENVAFNCGVVHEEGENFGDFAARAWAKFYSVGPYAEKIARPDQQETGDSGDWDDEAREQCASGPYVIIGDGYHSHPGVLWVLMSDLLHGRDSVAEVVQWEAGDLLNSDGVDIWEAASMLSEVMILNLRQIRVCLATGSKDPGLNRDLLSTVERMPAGRTPPMLQALVPLKPNAGLHQRIVEGLKNAGRAYELVMQGQRPAGRLYRDDEFSHLLFYERRARAAHWAGWALEQEKEQLGDAFNPANIDVREFQYIMAAEMAGLISVWAKGEPLGNAAAVCSSALRSAYWLWLEDDDRAMALLRSLLEQCARLSVWAGKRDRAEKLEGSPATTPKDWINSAGYRRLSALNRALGEFAHTHARVRQAGAREILQNIQQDSQSEKAIHTARGHALDSLSLLLMEACVKAVSAFSPVVADAFREIMEEVSGGDGAARNLEAFKNRTHAQRGASLGDRTFYRPPDWIFRK
ncbi:hypothetical protein [Streptomyces sp. NPDC127084]|uniref:hypothetical protein n=1 Tax=Streptomyces sp. NPDC127084 TaxID=3347133 RepID=UPI003662D2D8